MYYAIGQIGEKVRLYVESANEADARNQLRPLEICFLVQEKIIDATITAENTLIAPEEAA